MVRISCVQPHHISFLKERRSGTCNILSKQQLYYCSGQIAILMKPSSSFIFLSPGFWLKESTYREQAEVHFKHQFVLLLQGSSPNSMLGYSTFQNLNMLMGDKLRLPIVKVIIFILNISDIYLLFDV